MTTLLIILFVVVFIAVVWLALAIIAYSSESDRRLRSLESRLRDSNMKLENLKQTFNTSARRANQHFGAFREVARNLGYCVHSEHTVTANIASILGGEPMKHEKKLVVHKLEPAKKLKVNAKAKRAPRAKK